ncbi:MAG: TolC family protein, partial [Sediminibacterium sp.]|nr:TolC family protein [Sediminibacterium sp.]
MKIGFYILSSIICVTAFGQSNSGSQPKLVKKWTLFELIDYAYKHNITAKITEVQAKIAQVNLEQSKLSPYPSVNANTGISQNYGKFPLGAGIFTDANNTFQNNNINISIPIFANSSIQNTIIFNQLNVKAAFEDLKKVKNDISTLIASYYLQAISANENIKIAIVQIEQTLKQLDITAKRVEAGTLPELNLLEIQSQLANDSANLIAVKFTYTQALLALKATLNLDLSEDFEVDAPPLNQIRMEPLADLNPEYVYRIALENLPEQQAFKYRLMASKKNIQINRQYFYPTISAGIGLNTSFTYAQSNFGAAMNDPYFQQISNNFNQGFNINVSIPIFNNGRAKQAFKNASLNYNLLGLQSEQVNQTLHVNIYNAYINAVNAYEKYEASKKVIYTSKQTYENASKRFEVGLLGVFELLALQNNYLKAQIQTLTFQFDYIFK